MNRPHLVRLCDRLVRDLTQGLAAQYSGDVPLARRELLHAQETILELRAGLRATDWYGGLGLAVYDFLHLELVRANVTKDPHVTEGCLDLVTDLAATWREATTHAAVRV